MRRTVDGTELPWPRSAPDRSARRRNHGVEEPGFSGRLRIEHLTRHTGVVEVRRSEPVSRQDDGEPRQGQSDPDLVESQPERPVGAETNIGSHEEERARGERVPCAGRQRRVPEMKGRARPGCSQPEEGERTVFVTQTGSGGRSPPRSSPASLGGRRRCRPAPPDRAPRGVHCSIGMEKTLTLPSSMVMVLTRSALV